MVTAKTKRVGFAALAMATLLMVAAPALAASSITVQSVSSCGSTVTVTVHNASSFMSLATVRAEATVNGTPMTASSSVALLPGQTARVSLKFGGVVSSVLGVGLSDDSTPF